MKKKRVSISVFQIFIALLIIIAIVVVINIVRENIDFEQIGITKELGDFDGNGTLEEPYKINKVEDLLKLARNVNNGKSYSNKYFELTSKLDFQNDESYNQPNSKYGDLNKDGKIESIKSELTSGRGFEAIGNTEAHAFEGIFKGNDNTIRNLYIVANSEEENILSGLFGNNKGEISNLKVTGSISVDEGIENKKIYIGMICAKNQGIIQACNTEGEIKVSNNSLNNIIEVAGITAENVGKIVDTANSVNIVSNQLKAGITAKNSVLSEIKDSGEIINCTNTGSIKENNVSSYYTAGIVADNDLGNITSCNNNGEIVGKYSGGIVGKTTGYIVACQNTGNISNVKVASDDTEIAGGICGVLETAKIENCKNTGEISGLTSTGGIVGENKGVITQSRNEGNLYKITGVVAKTVNLGGIVGKNSPTAKILNCKNFAQISSETDTLVNMGGICGIMYNTSTIENCENNGELSGAAKVITPNGDVNEKCTACASYKGGKADTVDFGELNIGLIYGKFE